MFKSLALTIAALSLPLASCGGDSEEKVYKKKPAPVRPAEPSSCEELLPQVAEECGRCHNGTTHPKVFDTTEKLKGARGRIQNGSMPPDRDLDLSVQSAFLNCE